MRNIFLYLILLALSPVMISCGGSSIKTSKLQRTDWSSYESYALLPVKNNVANRFDSAIFLNINEHLTRKGFKLDKEDPDLLVLVHTMMNNGDSAARKPVHASYDYISPTEAPISAHEPYFYEDFKSVNKIIGYDIDQIAYQEGSIIIDLIDRNTKTIVWRGKSDGGLSPDNLESELQKNMDAIFSSLP